MCDVWGVGGGGRRKEEGGKRERVRGRARKREVGRRDIERERDGELGGKVYV